MIETRSFGVLPDGRDVRLFKITNSTGESVELLDYGASLHGVWVRDSGGRLGDVVLGVADASGLPLMSFEGSVMGRCANRIAQGAFSIDGTPTQLDRNRGDHHLHGGCDGYANQLFEGEADADGTTVRFRHRDLGLCGYGNAVDVEVGYTFDDDRALSIRYRMTPEADTVLCPTNHAYFDLSCSGDVRGHGLRIAARRIAAKGECGVPAGEYAEVEGTALDFRETRRLGEALGDRAPEPGRGGPVFDDCFVLDDPGAGPVAELRSPESGRTMQVETDMPAMILFTPRASSPRIGKAGRVYEGYCAVCLETQFVPNAINCPSYASPLFRAGQPLASRTVYRFGVAEEGGAAVGKGS